MLTFIDDMPDNVLAIKASGKITHEDYRERLIPAAEEKLSDYGKIKCLYVIDEDFDGYELSAMWDDAAFGIKHWTGFSHIVIVSDLHWVHTMATMFAPLIPAEVKLFKLAELDQAKDWMKNTAQQAA